MSTKENLLKEYEPNNKGEVVEVTDVTIKKKEKKLAKLIDIKTGSFELLNQEEETIKLTLQKQDRAIQAVLSQMVLGRHYIEIQESNYLTQEGADFIARALGISVTYEVVGKTFETDIGFVEYEYKAIGSAGGKMLGEAEASANSLEESHKKAFMTFDQKTKEWSKTPNKSVFDILNTIKQKAQIRAKKKLIRNVTGISGQVGQDPELIDNPQAPKHAQQGIYRELYKRFLDFAPEPKKKKKNKNGTWKTFTDKEKLTQRKEWVRVNVLQPYLLSNGLPTHNWGIKDIEVIKEALQTLEVPNQIEQKEVQNEPK